MTKDLPISERSPSASLPETVLTNARLVTRDAVVDGTVVLRGGLIAEVAAGPSHLPGAIDLQGDYLMPGLIEMHTDNMEKHFEPRPGVLWPNAISAVIAHDVQIAGAGITTVFDAIAVGEYDPNGLRGKILTESIAAVKHAQAEGMLRAEHLLHMRCEVSDACVVEMFEPYAQDPLVRLVSVMDHTPGQRQWSDISKFVQYNKGETWTEEHLDGILRSRRQDQALYSAKHRRQILALCAGRGDIALASHDDATEAHIHESLADGCAIAEFPITVAAAALARQHGMGTILGAPNVCRGGSHSGNVSALDLAKRGLLGGLSSDYVPSSLLQAAFLLTEKADMPLPEAVACVSANIAEMVGLDDRGRLAGGLRADVIQVRHADRAPLVRQAWRGGERVF
jgi:alpha-D-ribose 1-methylphosphonate 5-triphosphate diphosphatase